MENQEKQLFSSIVAWAKEREISNPPIQLTKVIEEIGEIGHEFSRGRQDTPEVADAIGDSIIALSVLAHTVGLDPYKCVEDAYGVIKHRHGTIINGSFVKEES